MNNVEQFREPSEEPAAPVVSRPWRLTLDDGLLLAGALMTVLPALHWHIDAGLFLIGVYCFVIYRRRQHSRPGTEPQEDSQ